MKKTKHKVMMKDILLYGLKNEKRRRSLRCSRCGKIVFFGMMLNGMCEKCADRLLEEVSELLKKERNTSDNS